jgi:two-component system CheB/CheR fusion protein
MAVPRDTEHFEEILQYLQQTHGFDFTAYKRASLMRRVLKRMHSVDVATFEDYFDYLQMHQEEFAQLFNTILINVTSFLRDPEVWTTLADDVLPDLVGSSEGIRVWSAGCASGQEPYSIAMLFAELMGVTAMRERVKIYATDVDEDALSAARAATFPSRDLENVKPEWVARYFEPTASGSYTVHRDVRRAVIFGRHDLLNDVPISRVHLLLCRNTLMYFTADAQTKVLSRFYFSLNPAGVIVLGRAEMLFSHGTMFAPIDLKRRIFRTVAKNGRDRAGVLAQGGRDAMNSNTRLRDAAFEGGAIAQVILDANRTVAFVNEPARATFRLSQADVGKPFQDLEMSYRPTELRGVIDKAVAERREVALKDVEWTNGGRSTVYNIVVTPLYAEDGALLGTRLTFYDVTEYKSLEAELQHSKQELETAYEELQSTNEELETTNEELQSTIEELETTNEELQSTNEELETMN